jgi:aminoglycoside phosphotransferase (APT) family kinase protein
MQPQSTQSPADSSGERRARVTRPSEREELLDGLRARGFSVEEEKFLSSRPDRLTLGLRTPGGTAVIAKVYLDDSGERTFEYMQRLWASPFGAARPSPGLAQPLDYLPDLRISLVERIRGKPMAETGFLDPTMIESAARLLADLHDCGVEPEVRRTWRGIVRSLTRKIQRISELVPEYFSAMDPVMKLLLNGHFKDSELVCAHGDFSARNVLVGGERVALIDWERLQQADPARDVAYFAVWGWRQRIQRGRMPDRTVLSEITSAYEACRPGSRLAKQMPFHIAAGLIRMCCTVAELWPAQSYLIPVLASLARRELESGA